MLYVDFSSSGAFENDTDKLSVYWLSVIPISLYRIYLIFDLTGASKPKQIGSFEEEATVGF